MSKETTYTLSGLVRYRSMPVAGVRVGLVQSANRFAGTPEQVVDQVITPLSGEYAFTVEPGEYFLNIAPSEGTRFITRKTGPLIIHSKTRLDIELAPGSVWNGKLAGNLSPDPAKYLLKVVSADQNVSLEKSLRVGESFALVLEKTRYRAYLSRPYSNSSAGDTEECVEIWSKELFIEGDLQQDIILPDLFDLAGLLVDANGNTVHGARIALFNAAAPERPVSASGQTLTTDNAGSFKCALPAGSYFLCAYPQVDSLLCCLQQRLTVKTNCECRLETGKGHKLGGRVYLGNNPVSNLAVMVKGEGHHKCFSEKTSGDGRFEFCLKQGTWGVCVSGQERETGEIFTAWSGTVNVACDSRVDINLKAGHKAVFEIVDDKERPISGAAAVCSLYTAQEGGASGKMICGTARSDLSGLCTFIVEPGVYTFDFDAPESGRLQSRQIRQLSITGNMRRKTRLQPIEIPASPGIPAPAVADR